MNRLVSLLTNLHNLVQDCLRYISLKSSEREELKKTGVLGEYYGEMEMLSKDISEIFDDQNNLSLIGDSDLMDQVGKIVEFFSSIPSDEILEKEDVNELNFAHVIELAKKQPQRK